MATADKGAAFTQRIVERVTAYAGDMIEGRRANEAPPFHP